MAKKEYPRNYNGSTPLLNERWELMVNNKIIHRDKPNHEIYTMSGYKQTGDNAEKSYQRAWRGNDVISKRYEYLLKEHNAALEKKGLISLEMWLSELSSIAFSNATDYAEIVNKTVTVESEYTDENGDIQTEKKIIEYKDVDFKLTEDLSDFKKKAIAGIKKTKDGIEIKNHDKMKALELLGNHFGYLKKQDDENAQEININFTTVKKDKEDE